MANPQQQFRRHAATYDRYSLIQTRVARALARRVGGGWSRIVDLGCGSGAFFRAYEHPFTNYLAIDIAPEMLARHPKREGVATMCGDFNDPQFFKRLATRPFDLLVSASALQWAEDLDWTLARIAELGRPVALALFTDGTFAALRKTAGLSAPIRGRDETERVLRRHFAARIETLRFRLFFDDRLAMLRYIKRSGVSGGKRRLSYSRLRRLLREYPHCYLEFEILLCTGVPRTGG